jgi:hypothetical protein
MRHKGKSNRIICQFCYSDYMLKTYRKNMEPALQYNSDLLSSRDLTPEELRLPLVSILRINGHGELINLQHLHNIVQIALANPLCTLALWSKRKDFIKSYFDQEGHKVPGNLILIYSNPIIDTVIRPDRLPKYFTKSFNAVDKDNHLEKQNCTGQKCKDCLLCYTHNDTSTIVEAIKKEDLYSKKRTRTKTASSTSTKTKTRQGVHISKMTGKLEGLLAINTNTVTNKFCQKMSATSRK